MYILDGHPWMKCGPEHVHPLPIISNVSLSNLSYHPHSIPTTGEYYSVQSRYETDPGPQVSIIRDRHAESLDETRYLRFALSDSGNTQRCCGSDVVELA